MSESGNQMLGPMRQGHITTGLVLFEYNECRRVFNHKMNAIKCFEKGNTLTSRVLIRLKEIKERRTNCNRNVDMLQNNIVKV